MATNILLKKSSVSGKVPLSADLVYGELAINYADGKLYFKDSNNEVKSFDSQIPTLQTITDAGASTTDTITVGGLEIGTYSFPTTAGSTDQVLALNASGDLEWTSIAALAGGIDFTDLSVTSNLPSGNGNLSYNDTNGVFTFTPADLSTKQDVLVSGTNIKTINGTSILGSGDIVISGGSGTSGVSLQSVVSETHIATAGQTSFAIAYTTLVEVFLNGLKLNETDYTATDGENVVLNVACVEGDVVSLVGYDTALQDQVVFTETYTALQGDTTFNITYASHVEVFLNGIKLTSDEYTATDGQTIVLNVAAETDDVIDLIGYLGADTLGSLGYATETYVDTAVANVSVDLTGYATETYVANAISGKVDTSSLATVATSGSYNDLTDKPSIPTLTSALTNDSGFITSSALSGYATESYVTTAISNLVDAAPTTLDTLNELAAALGDDANFATTVTTALGNKADTSSLATVATSGLYSDLTGTPTIPTVTSDLTNDSGFITSSALTSYATETYVDTGLSAKADTSSLATVATSGLYSDLTGTPSLFSGSYNDLTDKPSIPTATSDLTNDSGFITAVTPAGSNTQIQFNNNGSLGASSSLTWDGTYLTTPYLRSSNSAGDEGGEILLVKPQTNTTISGTGVTIDVYQNKLRIFEQGGDARGVYIDITAAAAGVGTNLLSSGGGTGGIALTDLSVTTAAAGSAALSYNNTSGVFTFTPPDLSSYATETYVDSAVSNVQVDLTGYATETYVTNGLSTKQNTLVSGTNIKTVNGISLLGSGNIVIEGGSGGSAPTEYTVNTTTTSAELVDTFSMSTYRSAEYLFTTSSNSEFCAFKVMVIHNDLNVLHSVSSVVCTENIDIGTVTSEVSGTDINLYYTPLQAGTEVKFIRTTINNSGTYTGNTPALPTDLHTDGTGTIDLRYGAGEIDLNV